MKQPEAYPLIAVAVALREAGMKISVGDILQGIEALNQLDEPFVKLMPVRQVEARKDGLPPSRRQMLIWFVQMLWARSKEEREIVRRVIDADIVSPQSRDCLLLAQALNILPQRETAARAERPRSPPKEPLEDLKAKAQEKNEEDNDTEESPTGGEHAGPGTGGTPAAAENSSTIVRMRVPDIEDETLPDKAPFLLRDLPELDELSLAAIWRRFRRPRLEIDRSSVDVEKSVQATVSAGKHLRVVHATRRVNQARLVVLMDVSSAMAPWTHMRRQMEKTLHPAASQLGQLTIRYFSNMPHRRLFESPMLRDPKPLRAQLKEMAGSPILVFGEAGAARTPIKNLDDRLSTFLGLTLENGIRPLVWINPMPRERWQPGFRQIMQAGTDAEAFGLTHDGLLAAIDKLRELN